MINSLNSLSLKDLLSHYPLLPKRFLSYFASQCAKEVMGIVPNPDPSSLKAVDMAERYGNGEDFTKAEWKRIRDDAYAATYATYSRAAAHATVSYAKASSYAVAYIYSSDSSFFKSSIRHSTLALNKGGDYFKPLLLSLIDKRLSKVEKMLIFGIESVKFNDKH